MSDSVRLRDYQQECIDDFLRRVSIGDFRIPSVLATGLGKGHPLDTDVPTPSGIRRWGDLKPGDFVFGRNGVSTEVIDVYDRGTLDTYRVTFSDESSILVDGDHLWHVRDSSISGRPWGNIETRRLVGIQLKRDRGWRFHVPMASPVDRTEAYLPLHPYVVGALISNGSMVSTGTQLTTPDLDVAARVSGLTECRKVNDSTPDICDRYSLPGLTQITKSLGMRVPSKAKRIPSAYLIASLKQRIELLHGLMDGDGSSRDTSRRSVGYFTSSEDLARDVSELVASLGGTGIVKRYDRGTKGVEYAVRILLPSDVQAFSTSRKSDSGSASIRNLQPKRAIISVQREGSAEIRCIRVAAKDSLYLIGRQYIVTHNTVIFSALAKLWIEKNPGRRVLVLAHTDELVQQAANKMHDAAPHLSVGIVKAETNQPTARVVVASVQTLRSERRRNQIRNVGLIIVDECHHATAVTYRTILSHFGAFRKSWECSDSCAESECPRHTAPQVITAGFTATLARGDNQKLSDIWQDCTFKRDIPFGIRRGYLIDVKGKRIEIPDFDLSQVKKSGGDYQDSSLADELERTFAPEIVAKGYAEHAGDRKGIVFVPTVESAYQFAAAFKEQDIAAEVVHGKLGKLERRLLLKRLASGDVQVVVNCAVLTEGFDDPTISCIVIARPTRSAPLYQQMVGRGLRPDLSLPSADRGYCLVLDVVGASRSHDLRSLVDLSERPIREELAEDEALSLLDMEEEEERLVRDAGQEDPYYGPVEHVDFDPLGRTTIGAWLQTSGGYYFLPAGKQAYVIIAPSAEPGQWDVAWLTVAPTLFAFRACPLRDVEYSTERVCDCGGNHQGSAGGLTEHKGLSVEMACSWAEEVMTGLSGGSSMGKTKAPWRSGTPSASQLFRANREGIDVPMGEDGKPSVNKGWVNDRISERVGTRRIDPVINFMINARGE